MRALLLLPVVALGFLACHSETDPDAARKTMNGTYEVTRLTQYQNNQRTFDGYLPYLVNDSVTIRHKVAISLGNSLSPQTDAFILRDLIQSSPKTTRSIGSNIGGREIRIKELSPYLYEFYRDGITKIGQYEGGTLSFDLIETDSINQPVRYVFQAKKISNVPNRF